MTVPKEATTPDMLRLAVAAVLEADKEFRANMPPEWEGDPLSDEIDGLRRVFSSTLPIAGEAPEGWQLVPKEPTPEMVTDGRVTSSDVEKCEMISDYGKLFRSQWARALRASPVPSSSEAIHPDDLAVDRFAAAMKTKLAKKRAEGRGGWDGPTCSADILSSLLRQHVDKGDPLDVGNLAMMLQQRGERISSPGKDGGTAGGPSFADGIRAAAALFETAPDEPVDDLTKLTREAQRQSILSLLKSGKDGGQEVEAVVKAADDALVSAVHAVFDNGVFVKDELLAPAEVRERVAKAVRSVAPQPASTALVERLGLAWAAVGHHEGIEISVHADAADTWNALCAILDPLARSALSASQSTSRENADV